MKATVRGARKLCKDLKKKTGCDYCHVAIDFTFHEKIRESVRVYINDYIGTKKYDSIEEARKCSL